MLQKNPLCPPVPFQPSRADAARAQFETVADRFVSAEDFDPTGVLAGVDPCESRYWWMPELGQSAAAPHRAAHAATGGRTAAAG